MKWKINIVMLFLLLNCFNTLAQETVSEKLYKANGLYEKGQLDQAITLANSCAINANNKSEKWQANRLLAMCYLANGEQKKARKAAENMMELNPKYISSKVKDPLELAKLIEDIKVIPKFSLGMAATAGGNITQLGVWDSYNVSDYKKQYTSENSWQFGLNTGYHLKEWLSFHTGIMAISKNYSISYAVNPEDFKVNERLVYLDAPLFVRLTSKPYKKFRLFADGGAYGGLLISSRSDFFARNTTTNESIESLNLNSISRRNKYEYGFLYGGGVMYKVKDLEVAVDVKYYLSLANITNESRRYKDQNLLFNYYYLDDNIRLNNLAISLSLFYNLNYQVIRSNK